MDVAIGGETSVTVAAVDNKPLSAPTLSLSQCQRTMPPGRSSEIVGQYNILLASEILGSLALRASG